MENPNGKESKSSINEMFDQSPCATFMSMLTMSSHSGACPIHSPPEIKSTHSGVSKASSKQKHKLKGENHETQWVRECAQGKYERRGSKVYSTEECFVGSSVYYGGPEELFNDFNKKIEAPLEEQKALKQLQQSMDPSFKEYTTRGNWWQGSLYY